MHFIALTLRCFYSATASSSSSSLLSSHEKVSPDKNSAVVVIRYQESSQLACLLTRRGRGDGAKVGFLHILTGKRRSSRGNDLLAGRLMGAWPLSL